MLPEAHADIERLLRDGAWFARLLRALVVRDDFEVEASPDRELVRHALPAPSPSEALAFAELRFELLDSVLALAEPWRGAVILRYLEGHRLARICEITSASELVVRRRLRRGLTWIRTVLGTKMGGGKGAEG